MFRCHDGCGHHPLHPYVLSWLYRQVHIYVDYFTRSSYFLLVDALERAPPVQGGPDPDAPPPKADERPCMSITPGFLTIHNL